MSIPVNHTTTNTVFQVDEHFADLGIDIRPIPATRGEINNVPVIVTCYELTNEEIEQITKFGKVFLVFVGQRLIPHNLTPFDPFKK